MFVLIVKRLTKILNIVIHLSRNCGLLEKGIRAEYALVHVPVWFTIVLQSIKMEGRKAAIHQAIVFRYCDISIPLNQSTIGQ